MTAPANVGPRVAAPRTSVPGLLRASHPGPGLAVTVLASAYAVSAGLGPLRILLVAGAVAAGQLTTGWSNDLVDAARDRIAGRRDKPLATGDVGEHAIRVACVSAAVATLVLSLACGLLPGTIHLLLVVAALAYNLGLKSTLLSWLPFAVAFGGLPVFVALSRTGNPPPPWWVPVAGALLGVGAHLLNVLPDLADDEITGVRGLGHRMGARLTPPVAVLALVAATVVLAVGIDDVPVPGLAALVVVVGGLSTVALTSRGRTPFLAAVGIALTDVLLLVVAA